MAEPSLEDRLIELLEQNGARLLTSALVKGRGLLGTASADLSGALVRMECFCAPERAEKIAAAIQKKFFKSYDIFLTISDAQVLRPEKF